MVVLYVCVSILLCQWVHLYHFSRFHICINIYLFFSLWLTSFWQSLGPSTSLQMAQFCFFLWLSNVPVYICTIYSLSILRWWTFRLLPCPGCCKQCCNEYQGTLAPFRSLTVMRELEVRKQEKVHEVAEPERSCKNLSCALLSFLTAHSSILPEKSHGQRSLVG